MCNGRQYSENEALENQEFLCKTDNIERYYLQDKEAAEPLYIIQVHMPSDKYEKIS